MKKFRLVFKRNSTIIEYKLKNGTFVPMEIYSGKLKLDAKNLDQLLSDLSGPLKSNAIAFDIDK